MAIDLQELASAIGQLELRFRVRRRTASDWTALNEVLLSAEIGLETDTGKIKIGDGTTEWNGLAYFGRGGVGSAGLSVEITAGEYLPAGRFAYVAADGLAYLASNASAATAAAVYTSATIASGATGDASLAGFNDVMTGLTAGTTYALGTGGDAVPLASIPTTPGTIIQVLGTATSTGLIVSIGQAIERG